MSMDCADVQRALWTGGPGAEASAHAETCLACRMEAKRFAQLTEVLRGMRSDLAIPPAGLEPALLSLAGRTRLRRVREAVQDNPRIWQGAAAAAAAAALGFGVLVARRAARPDPAQGLRGARAGLVA